ncbi:MAG: tetraacyldisaccharide 4'-kinase [Mariprofundus sp.]|nr:tetraacyldisaccharide 4'-kinase [Mariprofundus sp.]
MPNLHNRIEQMWWKPCQPPLLLRCIEPVYAAISRIHLNRRAAHTTAPPLPMISVGNITAGGSGKTPFVLWLADLLNQTGYSPVILCRGNGGKNSSPTVVSPDADVKQVGDEAKMLAEMSGCPTIVAADRIAACSLIDNLGDVLIMDDGFQYRHLERCCDIVLVPAEGTGNGHLIPAGPLREPVTALDRASIIVRTGSKTENDRCQPLGENPEWYWVREPTGLIDAMGGDTDHPDSIYAVTTIARPQRFFDDLKNCGLELSGTKSYPDHHPFTDKDVLELLHLHKNIAVTAKDAVKLVPLWPKKRPLWLLQLQGTGQPGLLDAITNCLPNISRKNKTPPQVTGSD